MDVLDLLSDDSDIENEARKRGNYQFRSGLTFENSKAFQREFRYE